MKTLRTAISLLLLLTLLLGVVYPLSILVVGQIAFNSQSNGSLILQDDKVIGSELLGQSFSEPKYFWGRLSANQYDPTKSGATHLSQGNPRLLEQANERIKALQKADPKNKDPIPVDLITASASGLDPHISPEAARWQLARVAKARGMKTEDLQKLIDEHTEQPLLGFIGKPRVNVLLLNLALDKK